jgi:hypothetical protein
VKTLEDLIRQAVKEFLDGLVLEAPSVLESVGFYRQKLEYVSKKRRNPKSLPRIEPILAAMIRLDREVTINAPDPGLFPPGVPAPKRIVIKAHKEYAESQVEADSPGAVDRRPAPPDQMSFQAALEFPPDLPPELIQQSVQKKLPGRIEISLALGLRGTRSA